MALRGVDCVMTGKTSHKVRQGLFASSLFLSLMALSPAGAAATYRYAESSNRIYVENGGIARLSDIRAALPDAPLQLVDATNKVWLLSANLIIEDGTTLVLHGTAIGGDVNELRLKSSNSSSSFVFISAEHGTIDIERTRIRSWDTATGTVDSSYSNGRAFIRVRSMLASDGVTPLESRMDVADSDIGYLGYNAAESYGLVWKVLGSTAGLFDKVQVRGNILNSRIHHNYYGVYTYGHQDGVWTGNQVDHNAGYGFDPHDDSDDLLIEDNDVHDNGNHGIIASKRCDHVVIRNNRSFGNAGNGIMLHRSSDDALVENNQAYLNEDSGIAIFASKRIVIRNNTVLDNGNAGMRFSMGAADNRIENNEVGNSGKYGFYFYRGSDTPEPNDDGRPKRNVFIGNTVYGSAEDGIKMGDGDANTFTNNVFRDNGLGMRFANSRQVRLDGNSIPSNVTLTLAGSSSIKTFVEILRQARVRLSIDTNSSARLRDLDNAIYDVAEPVYMVAGSSSAFMDLNDGNTGGDTIAYRRRMFATPSTGTVRINVTHWNTTDTFRKHWRAIASTGSMQVQYSVGDLVAGAGYQVFQGSRLLGTFTATSAGTIAFTATPGTTSELSYVVRPV